MSRVPETGEDEWFDAKYRAGNGDEARIKDMRRGHVSASLSYVPRRGFMEL